MKEFKSYEVVIRNEKGEEIISPVEVSYPVPQVMYREDYDEYEAEIAILNKAASALLLRNEDILKDNGYDPPEKNTTIKEENRWDRLCIPPKGYIRPLEKFRDKYDLRSLYVDIDNNPAYSKVVDHLQMTDWFNYVLNRINIFGGIKILVHKYAYINVVSIIEAFIQEASFNCYCYCSKCNNEKACDNIDNCMNYLSKKSRRNFKTLLKRLQGNDILGLYQLELNEDPYDVLIELYDKRNNVHIYNNTDRLTGESEENDNFVNELNDERKVVNLYNKAIRYLWITNNACIEHMVPYYDKCKGFVNSTDKIKSNDFNYTKEL